MKRIRIVTLLVLSFTLFNACTKDEVNLNQEKANKDESESSIAPSFSIEDRDVQPTILGEQKENPFSVENMQIALDSLIANIENVEGGVNLKSAKNIEIKATDLYVRFLPKDSIKYSMLESDTTLKLFDIPLDYDVEQLGDYYYDSTLTTPYTWQYTTVKPDYIAPIGIEYEILSELFIIENSEDYTEEIITDTTSLKIANTSGLIDQNICNALYAISFTLTGNGDELQVYDENEASNLKSTITKCTRKCIGRSWWKTCWTSCDTYYYPEGFIKLETPSSPTGVKGTTVRMWRWFSYTDAITSSSGYYKSKARFNKLWTTNSVKYKILFKGKRYNNNWVFNKTIAGSATLWRDGYGAGRHSPNGHSMTFLTNSAYWGRCVLNNALYDYMYYAKKDGISLPPSNLDIADKNSSEFTSSAPLLKRHFNFSLVKAHPIWGSFAELYYPMVYWALPDLILRYNQNMSDYEKITAIAWHELTHASQLQRMKSEKGFWWASDYWSSNVVQQAQNTIDNDKPYGNKGDSRWQQIALSEGWANYREWYLGNKYLNYNHLGKDRYDRDYYFSDYSGIPIPYGEMFDRLKKEGCSFANMEKALCTYSISGYKNNLVSKYPAKKDKLISIIESYE